MLLRLTVIFIGLAQLHHAWLQFFHFRHGLIRPAGQREERQFDQNRHNQNRYAVIANQLIEKLQGFEHWLGQEIEPSPIDHQVEALNALVGVIVNHVDNFGTGKELAGRCIGAAAGNAFAFQQKVAAESNISRVGRIAGGVAGCKGIVLRRDNRRGPIFIGNAEPTGGGLLFHRPVFQQVIIVELLQAGFAEEAQWPFVQNEQAAGFRQAGADNLTEWIDGDCIG